MRTGIGYDIHRLIPTVDRSSIPIGGVPIPCFFKVEAHSDGDVLLHALVDACLGALALGDIGIWFPDSQPENFKRPSASFVNKVLGHVHKLGWKIRNVDSIILLEEPKLGEYRESIRQEIAHLLRIELASVSVKAKTMEGLGSIGERRAIAAHVVVTLEEEHETTGH